MKKQKTQSRLLVAMAAVIVLLVALSATLTFAWFTASSSAASKDMKFGYLKFTDTTFNITADAHAYNTGVNTGTLDRLVPGCEITFASALKVKTNIRAAVRIGLKVEVWSLYKDDMTTAYVEADTGVAEYSDGVYGIKNSEYSAKAAETGNSLAKDFYALLQGKIDALTYATEDTEEENPIHTWLAGGDGYQYYTTVLKDTDGLTDILGLAGDITIPTSWGKDWQNKTVRITYVAQAIQVEHIVDGDDEPITLTDGAKAITAAEVAELVNATAWADATTANNA